MTDTIVGIDLGGTQLVLHCAEREETLGTGLSFTPKELITCLQSFLQRHDIQPKRIGLAIPGLVEEGGRVVECDVLPAFKGWQASGAMHTLCTQTTILNDVQAALLEETHDEPPNVTAGVVLVGTAVGAAFHTNGRPLLGKSGWAGELGYFPLVYQDTVKRLDEVAGGAALAASFDVRPETLAQRAKAGDPATLRAIEQAGKCLGLGLAAVINLLNPSLLSVGGGTSELPGYWEAAVLSAKHHTLPNLWTDCSLSKIKAGRQTVVLGAVRAAASDPTRPWTRPFP